MILYYFVAFKITPRNFIVVNIDQTTNIYIMLNKVWCVAADRTNKYSTSAGASG